MKGISILSLAVLFVLSSSASVSGEEKSSETRLRRYKTKPNERTSKTKKTRHLSSNSNDKSRLLEYYDDSISEDYADYDYYDGDDYEYDYADDAAEDDNYGFSSDEDSSDSEDAERKA